MLQVIRSWTRQPLSVSIEVYQSPVVLYDQAEGAAASSTSYDAAGTVNHIGLGVTLTGEGNVRIGGVTLIRQVLLRRRKPKTKDWTDWEEMQRAEFPVVGECVVGPKERFDAYLPTPCHLPETRHTTYDQVVHLLTAIVHDLSPLYGTVIADPTKLDVLHEEVFESRNMFPTSTPGPSRDRPNASRHHSSPGQTMPRRQARNGVLALCHKTLEVVHCPSLRGDVPQLESEQIVRMSDSGKVSIKAASHLLVLGSWIDVALDFYNLTSDTTIHAVSVILIQETCTPLKAALPDLQNYPVPSPPAIDQAPRSTSSSPTPNSRRHGQRSRPVLGRLSSMWAQFKEKPPLPQSSVIDEYALLSEGVSSVLMSNNVTARDVIGPPSFLWRGEAGRILDTRDSRQTSDDVYLDDDKGTEHHADHHDPSDAVMTERSVSAFRLHRRVRLPSQVNGAHHSTSTLVPYFAQVSHRLVVDVIYSVLGQDELGQKKVSKDTSAPLEGSKRRLTTKFELELGPCTLMPESIQPPSYVSPPPLEPTRRRLSTSSSVRGKLSPTRRNLALPETSAPTLGRRTSIMSHCPSFKSLERSLSTGHVTDEASSNLFQNSGIAHSRAFRASNGRVIAPKRVFYSEHDERIAAQRHRREKGCCACGLT